MRRIAGGMLVLAVVIGAVPRLLVPVPTSQWLSGKIDSAFFVLLGAAVLLYLVSFLLRTGPSRSPRRRHDRRRPAPSPTDESVVDGRMTPIRTGARQPRRR